MMDLYKHISLGTSRLITQKYSTSFTLGIRTLHKRLHDPIYAIYGFVRIADEIVDTFHNHNKKQLLDKFRSDTWDAIEQGISTNPVLQSFQWVVNQYRIDHHLIEAFFESMEMDLQDRQYQQDSYATYIYGSAEVVGLMCLRVFVDGDDEAFDRLKVPARALGAAFQKVNFLRDMKSDFAERGRVYFPGVDFNHFTDQVKKQIEADIEADYRVAYKGIMALPIDARFGVYVAYIYYRALLKKITRISACRIRHERIRVPNDEKFALLCTSWFRFRLNLL